MLCEFCWLSRQSSSEYACIFVWLVACVNKKTDAGKRKLPIREYVSAMFQAIIEDRENPAVKKIIDGHNYDFSFSEGRTRQFLLMYMVPLVIALRIADISLYDDFVNGKNDKPLKDLFEFDGMREYVLSRMLNRNEALDNIEGKKIINYNEKVESLYRAIFVTDYTGNKYSEVLGECEFDVSSLAGTTSRKAVSKELTRVAGAMGIDVAMVNPVVAVGAAVAGGWLAKILKDKE